MKHWFEQRRQVGALARLLLAPRPKHPPTLPGPTVTQRPPLPSRSLVEGFVRFCGGDPSAYRDTLPPHLFPHWSLPAWLTAARALPYPPTKVINLGCSVRFEAPLRRRGGLEVRGQLVELDDDGYRAKCALRAETHQFGRRCVRADLQVLIPYRKKPRAGEKPSDGEKPSAADKLSAGEKPSAADKPRAEPTRVAGSARELSYRRLSRSAGAQFAQLTGDVNPIHWSPAYARAVGFPSTILHGFAALGLGYEALVRGLLANDVGAVAALDARFERPLVLPAAVGVYYEASQIYVADAPGSRCYMTGRVELKQASLAGGARSEDGLSGQTG